VWYSSCGLMKLKDTEVGSSGSHLQTDAWVAAGGSNDSSLALAPRKWSRFRWKRDWNRPAALRLRGSLGLGEKPALSYLVC
jgi:hypothetical protein